ncbi:MAG: DUF1257 domain-containing protein [Anaerolineae bacterium]|nr:DUF1257 domain-containing protein [Anaerolineae bacterium]
MSHISKIKTQMVDKEMLLLALSDLGYRTEEGRQKLDGLRNQSFDIDIKVVSRFGNDIGLKLTDGVFEIIADWWGVMGTTQEAFTKALTQRYAYRVVTDKLQKQGFALSSEENNNGKIHLVLRRISS